MEGRRAPLHRRGGAIGSRARVGIAVLAIVGLVSCVVYAPSAMAAGGPVAGWGRNDKGQLGDNSTSPSSVPVQVLDVGGSGNLSGVVSVATGFFHTVAAKSDGTVWAWGDNSSGQLGDNSNNPSLTPVQVVGAGGVGTLSGITAVAAGVDHTLALGPNGTVWAWGANNKGQLGDGSNNPSLTPVEVRLPTGAPLTGITAIAAGNEFSLALTSGGGVLAWGYNVDGELGDGSTSDSTVPVPVVGQGGQGTLSGIAAIAAADAVGYAVTNNGTLWAWGYGGHGELGNGSTVFDSTTPVVVGPPGAPLSGVVAVAGGTGGPGLSHALALKSDGSVWAWGYNTAGELGNNSTSDSSVPVPVLGPGGNGTLAGITAVAAGDEYSAALKSDGSVWTWGLNVDGELGNGTTSSGSTTPVQVVDLPHAVALQTGCCSDSVFAIGPVGAVPVVTGVSPSSGPPGTVVTITGAHLSGATAVSFGSQAASFAARSDTQIDATAPAGSGTVDVTVTAPTGSSPISQADRFTYTQAAAPAVIPKPATVQSSSAATLSGQVNPDGRVTSAHFEYGLDPRYRPSGGAIVYDQSTPTQALGSGFADGPISALVSGLVPNALYHVRLVASNAVGTTFGPDQTFMTLPAPAPPPPVLGRSENFTPSGTVFVLEHGQFVELTQSLQLPTGTVVDATRGSVSLVAAGGGGLATDARAHKRKRPAKSTGTFGGAVFKVTQNASGPNKGLTTLTLIEGGHNVPSYGARCKAKGASDAAHIALSRRILQTLRSRASGRFRTRGRYAAGTVRGTQWTTTDRCDGTLIAVQVHTVLVTDFVKHVTIAVHAGHSYLARPRRARRA
jgi:hypothetical protein